MLRDGVVWQVGGGHQQRVYVLRAEALHVGLGQVGVQVTGQVVVARRELEVRRQITDAFVRGRDRRQDWSVVARAFPEYRAEIKKRVPL